MDRTCEISAIVFVEQRSSRIRSRKSSAVANAGLPYTTACSPEMITLPGAETITVVSFEPEGIASGTVAISQLKIKHLKRRILIGSR